MNIELSSDSILQGIVEAMLPRWSGSELGLLMQLDLNITDHGYPTELVGKRRPLTVRKYPAFLIIRPMNYTQVYFWMPADDGKGHDVYAKYLKGPIVWSQKADHDSEWREAFSTLGKLRSTCLDSFKKRIAKGLKYTHLYERHNFMYEPMYVRVTENTRTFPNAEREPSHEWDDRFLHNVTIAPVANCTLTRGYDTNSGLSKNGIVLKD